MKSVTQNSKLKSDCLNIYILHGYTMIHLYVTNGVLKAFGTNLIKISSKNNTNNNILTEKIH